MIGDVCQNELAKKLSDNIKIDHSRLVLGGHSFGGITAIGTAMKDDRVKAVFAFDPWYWSYLDEVRRNSGLKVPTFLLTTAMFNPIIQ